MKRIMGIDFGDRNIGIAVSDLLGLTAQPLKTIKWNSDINEPIFQIKELVLSSGCDIIVLGFPRNMNGTVGKRAKKTCEFAERLKKDVPGCKIILWDERLSTKSASRAMSELGLKPKKKKQIIDQIAAVLILQSYLDQRGAFYG